MKSPLQTIRNRRAGILPVPEAPEPSTEFLLWTEHAIAALDAAFGTPEAVAATRAGWEKRRNAPSSGIMFASIGSATSIVGSEFGVRIARPLSDRKRPDAPDKIENVVDAFLSANPPTRMNLRAFAERMRTEVNRRFDGDAPAFYRAAGISRFQYSKLLSHPEENRPAKETALQMALAFQFSVAEAADFLRIAGYALSPDLPSDRVWAACLDHGLYHLPSVRRLLARHGGSPSARSGSPVKGA